MTVVADVSKDAIRLTPLVNKLTGALRYTLIMIFAVTIDSFIMGFINEVNVVYQILQFILKSHVVFIGSQFQ